MIIDAGGYLGNFPFRKIDNNTPSLLAKTAKTYGITHMIVASIDAVFYKDSLEGNLKLYNDIYEYNKKSCSIEYIPFAVVNPTYPNWQKDTEKLIHKYKFAGIELFPCYNGYTLKDRVAHQATKFAENLGIPVRIANGFENIRQRSNLDVFVDPSVNEITTLVKTFPNVRFILIGHDSYSIAKDISEIDLHNNVFIDFSRNDFHHFADTTDLKSFFVNIDFNKIIFATFSPLQYIDPQFVKLHLADLNNMQKDMICFENLEWIIKK